MLMDAKGSIIVYCTLTLLQQVASPQSWTRTASYRSYEFALEQPMVELEKEMFSSIVEQLRYDSHP